jgi:hypothetical protein
MVSSMPDELSQNEREALETFPAIAREFCEFVDVSVAYDVRQLLRGLAVQLARLCEIGARLPWVTPVTDGVETNAETTATHTKKRMALEAILREKLGTFDGYWQVFDPTQREEPVHGSLSADIAEIYLDLRDGLGLLQNGTAQADVYWQWRFDFREHWVRHATDALKVTLLISG